ncbi:hypothetical protein BDW02DRAFT_598189 [Decorospora gaudefroyi]|uniref:Uncharacterized protein n=1 Tax=Decorospora gaudefroyi TaxID=184978 RepID=A0A6A5KFG0_9PLEO|nr:hypothetical protein BDW02DRAFT_598189 [Decorospora gaudefroyi]
MRTNNIYLAIGFACCSLVLAHPQEDQPVTSFSIVPQSGLQSGATIQTTYQSIEGLTDNTVTTTVIDGTTTILPVWYCAPTATAAACQGCPQSENPDNEETSCDVGFNALVLLPLVAVPGVFLPPPEGLPTITIDNGEPREYTPPPTPEPEPETSITPTPTPTPTPSSSSMVDRTPEVDCVLATNKAKDYAQPTITTVELGGSYVPPPPESSPINPDDLPFLPLQLEGGGGNCDGSGRESRYFAMPFYQFGNTFTRGDAITAVREFCATHAKNKTLLGPTGKGINKDGTRYEAGHIFQGDYDTPESGKISVRAMFDVDNRLSPHFTPGEDCNNNGDTEGAVWMYTFSEISCTNYLAQTFEFCPKNTGGTYYYRCTIWETFKWNEVMIPLPENPEDQENTFQ